MDFQHSVNAENKNLYIKEEPCLMDVMESEDNNEDDDQTVMSDSVDPLDLLKIVQNHNSDNDNAQYEMSEGSRSEGKWEDWMKMFPWVLHEESDGAYAVCLYCNVKVCIRVVNHIRKHAATTFHKEREETYMAFKSHEAAANQSMPNGGDIKQEFSALNSVPAMKQQRALQTKALNDYSWERWLLAHDWLERCNKEGTIGYCKICELELNVEFSYMRQRHEETTKHKYGDKLKGRMEMMRGENEEDMSKEEGNDTQNVDGGVGDIGDNEENDDTNSNQADRMEKDVSDHSWFVATKVKNRTVCKLCKVNMSKSSIRKHLMSQQHKFNFKQHRLRNQKRTDEKKISWKIFEKAHPWLMEDPDDNVFGYCKYCEKRISFCLSKKKRRIHEQSITHREAASRILNQNKESGDKSNLAGDGDDENSNGNVENGTPLVKDKPSVCVREGESAAIKKMVFRGSKEWFKLYPWFRKNENHPGSVYCKICRIILNLTNLNAKKHEKTTRHQVNKRAFVENNTKNNAGYIIMSQRKKLYCSYCNEQFLRANIKEHMDSESHKSSVAERKEFQQTSSTVEASNELGLLNFYWLSFKRSGLYSTFGYCKYCNQSIFVPTVKFALKHEQSKTHKQAYAQSSDAKNQQLSVLRNGKRKLEEVDSEKREGKSEESHTEDLSSSRKRSRRNSETNEEDNKEAHRNTDDSDHGGHESDGFESISSIKSDLSGEANEDSDIFEYLLYQSAETLQGKSPSETLTEGANPAYAIAKRLTAAHAELLRLTRKIRVGFKEESKEKSKSFMSTPLTIAACLSPYMKNPSPSSSPKLKPKPVASHSVATQTNATQTSLEHKTQAYDLFFESINATMKELPTDLASEGRVKFMQVLYDLEMRALKRKQSEQRQGAVRITTLKVPQKATVDAWKPAIGQNNNNNNNNNNKSSCSSNFSNFGISRGSIDLTSQPSTSKEILSLPSTQTNAGGMSDDKFKQIVKRSSVQVKAVKTITPRTGFVRYIPVMPSKSGDKSCNNVPKQE